MEVYIDGSCKNGVAAYAAHFPERPDLDVANRLTDKIVTCARAEVMALSAALSIIHQHLPEKDVKIFSDNSYVVSGYTTWMYQWARQNWNELKHDDLWRQIYRLRSDRIHLIHVPGHAGNVGNEIADKMARGLVEQYASSTYQHNPVVDPTLDRVTAKLRQQGYGNFDIKNIQSGVNIKIPGITGSISVYTNGRVFAQAGCAKISLE
jgi:ribonuclease HI